MSFSNKENIQQRPDRTWEMHLSLRLIHLLSTEASLEVLWRTAVKKPLWRNRKRENRLTYAPLDLDWKSQATQLLWSDGSKLTGSNQESNCLQPCFKDVGGRCWRVVWCSTSALKTYLDGSAFPRDLSSPESSYSQRCVPAHKLLECVFFTIVLQFSDKFVFAIRLCVYHQHPSWSFRHSDHREAQDGEHPGWERTASLRSIPSGTMRDHGYHQICACIWLVYYSKQTNPTPK